MVAGEELLAWEQERPPVRAPQPPERVAALKPPALT